MAGVLPLCVPCKRRRVENWNGRLPGAGAAYEPVTAAYLVTVGRSQVERFECVRCQADTGNPIKVRLEEVA